MNWCTKNVVNEKWESNKLSAAKLLKRDGQRDWGATVRPTRSVAMKRTSRMTLVFDADGVVIDPPHRFMHYQEQVLGIPRKLSSEFFRGVFLDCLVGKADLKDAIAPFLPRWGWRGSVDDFLRRWFDEENQINHKLVQFIQELRSQGYYCAIATNQEKYRLRYMREEMGFAGFFDAVFGSADVGEVKPNAGFYREVTDRLGAEPSRILFWDDSEANVDGARAFGWRAEHYTGMEGFVRTMKDRLAQ